MRDGEPLILMLDDDPDILESQRTVLESKGYRVTGCLNPGEALQEMAREKPDLILADLMMSGFDAGFLFARKVKADERFRDVPIIIVTGISTRLGLDFTPETREELAEMYADAFLQKPVSPEGLVAKVRDLIG